MVCVVGMGIDGWFVVELVFQSGPTCGVSSSMPVLALVCMAISFSVLRI